MIYYIGCRARTNLFKRRLSNHILANTKSKFHAFIKLVGIEHFKVSIVELCAPKDQPARENYFLQKYLPLLNTVYSSSITEKQIYATLSTQLANLKGTTTPVGTEVYVYDMIRHHISQIYAKYESLNEARKTERRSAITVSKYLDTNVPLRGKLYRTTPIIDFKNTFKLAKTVSKGLRHDLNIAQTVWAYDALLCNTRFNKG